MTPRPQTIWIAAAALWAAVMGGGFFYLSHYKSGPGERREEAHLLPGSNEIRPEACMPTLVVAVHPRCPCSRATMEELARTLAAHPHGLRVRVLFWKPAGASDDWSRTGLWEQAKRLPGATVSVDEGGVELKRFGAATSGHVLFYAGDGRLLFSGGVTVSRGHEGDSASLEALRRRIRGETDKYIETPVFGCPISD